MRDDGLALWHKVRATVTPLPANRDRPEDAAGRPAGHGRGDDAPAHEGRRVKRAETRPSARKTQPVQTPARPKSPPLSGVDRRTRQRLLRGQIAVEARIDLHGMRRLDARDRLIAFLARSRADGVRWALVITGKGASPYARHTLHGAEYSPSPGRTGVLRDAVAGWLAEPEFGPLVSGFQPAHPRHGGGGAFYVRLRRLRGAPR